MISLPSPTCLTVALSPDSNSLFFAKGVPGLQKKTRGCFFS